MKASTSKAKLWAAVFWLGLWQVTSMTLGTDLLLPSPLGVMQRLVALGVTLAFWQSVAISSGRILVGFVLAVMVGCVCAGLAQHRPWLQTLLLPPLACMKSVPVASFIILALVWVPTKNLSTFIAFLMAFPLIYTNVFTGLLETNPQLLEMAQVFAVPKLRQFRGIVFPSILPYLRSGCALAMGLCWKAGIAAEFIGLPRGTMGQSLYNAKVYFEVPDLFAWTVAVVAVSLLWERLFLWCLGLVARKVMTV